MTKQIDDVEMRAHRQLAAKIRRGDGDEGDQARLDAFYKRAQEEVEQSRRGLPSRI